LKPTNIDQSGRALSVCRVPYPESSYAQHGIKRPGL
jgi:hypothetical protein